MCSGTAVVILLFVAVSQAADITLNDTYSDIARPDAEVRFARQAQVDRAWPNAIVPIFFAPDYPQSQKADVEKAMAIWEKFTCLRFRRNDMSSPNRVKVSNGGYCQSDVGRVGKKEQYLSLPRLCLKTRTSVHELGHTIGMQHTVTRPDRDQYVYVDAGNIATGQYDLNFAVVPNVDTLMVPYDIKSIMHYTDTPNGMVRDRNRPAISPKRPELMEYAKSMGNFELSFYDILMVNKMYRCDTKCANSPTRCANGGVPDVNDCSRCICPVAWGGRLCNENHAGATLLTAQAAPRTEQARLGSGTNDRNEYTTKAYVINAPSGRRIRLTVDYIWTGDSTTDCPYGGLEINTKMRSLINGVQVCINNPSKRYESEGNRMVLRVYNSFSTTSVNFSYSFF